MVPRVDKLIRKLGVACKGKEVMVVIAALETIMEGVLEQTPDVEFRNHLTLRLIHMLVFSPAFEDIEPDESEQNLATVATISDNDLRNACLLGKIKAAAGISAPLSIGGQPVGRLSSLRRPYKPRRTDVAEEIIRNLYEFAAGAARVISWMPEADVQLRTLVVYIQTLIAMSEFDGLQTSKLKEVLRAVASIPDEDFRNAASLTHIQNIVAAYREGTSPT